MSTFNRTVNQNSSGATVPVNTINFNDGRHPGIMEAIIDFSTTGNAHAAGDIFNTLVIPAGYAILGTGAEVLVADSAGNSGTIQLKTGSTGQGSAVAPSSTGYLATVGTFTPVVPAGANVMLNTVIATGAINAVVRVFAFVMDTRNRQGTGVCTGAGVYASPTLSYTYTTATNPVP